MAQKTMKRCLLSLAMQKMQIQTRVKQHFIPTRRADVCSLEWLPFRDTEASHYQGWGCTVGEHGGWAVPPPH